LTHEIFQFSLQFSVKLINLANGQIFYENQPHEVNIPKMGKCYTIIVGQSNRSRYCYWIFMFHMRPVSSQQGGLCGLSPPKTQIMHQGPQIENENYKLKSFVNLYIVKALTRKPKLTLTITSGYFHPKHTNHNVG